MTPLAWLLLPLALLALPMLLVCDCCCGHPEAW